MTPRSARVLRGRFPTSKLLRPVRLRVDPLASMDAARVTCPRRGRLGWGRTPERVGFHLLPVLLLFAVGTLPAAASPQDDIALSRENALVRAIDRASPAVVNINSTRIRRQRVHTFFDWFEPRTQTRERRYRSLGSGAVFDAKHGYVLTNQHVIQGAD